MDRGEHRSLMRGALARGDGGALVGLLTEGAWPEDALQLIGDGLLAAPTEGAAELALRCIDALDDRGWEGDAELVDQLNGALGRGPTPLLRPLPVDLADLAGVLEGDPSHGGGRVDLQTGQVWPQLAIDDAQEFGEDDLDEGDDPDRWLWVNSEGSRAGYRDMELFIDGLDDADAADRLSIAISGRGAFRRFKDVLTRWPDLFDRWSSFSEDRRRGRARTWLAAGLAAEFEVPQHWEVTTMSAIGHVPRSAPQDDPPNGSRAARHRRPSAEIRWPQASFTERR